MMTVISNVNSAALLILQQTSAATETSEKTKSGGDDLIAVANGVSSRVGVSAEPGQAQSKISESMFGVNNVNINKLKLDLIERVGAELGFKESDFESKSKFVSAMQLAVVKMKESDYGKSVLAEIGKKLGLDEMDLTVEDVVRSARDPEREDKVTRALQEREGMLDEDRDGQRDVQPDDIGLYGMMKS